MEISIKRFINSQGFLNTASFFINCRIYLENERKAKKKTSNKSSVSDLSISYEIPKEEEVIRTFIEK